jgi:serine/threonine-protein kinase
VTATRPAAGAAPPRARSSRTLVWKIFLANAAVVAVVLAGTLALLALLAQRTADAAVGRGLDQTRQMATTVLGGRERSLASAALIFVQDPPFRALVIAKHPEADLLDRATEAAERIGTTWVQITDDQGVRLAKSDDPVAPHDTLAGSALIAGALDGQVVFGAGVSGDSALFQAVAVPILESTQVAGALMAAKTIDSTLAQAMRRATSSEIVFYLVDATGAPRVAASTIGAGPAVTAFLREYAARVAPEGSADGAAERAELRANGTHYVGNVQPLHSAGGDVLGGFVALRDRELEMAPFTALRRRLVLAGVVGLGLAFALSFVVARQITRPVLALVDATRRVAEGDYSVDVTVREEGEIGTLADAMREMVNDLQEKQALLGFLGAVRSAPAPTHTTEAQRAVAQLVADPDAPFARGRTVANRYRLTDVLGVGGTGVVYKATDLQLGETVAVKTLRPDVLLGDPAALERLKSEIRLARRISHRNVIRIHDIGEADGVSFITMEFVAGTSLADLIERAERVPAAATLALGKQLCRALAVAHEQGIIHRDVKPQNLIVQPDGVLKVMDFGVARLARRTAGLTRAGMVVGTPAYMAPEQLLDEDVDARADLFAVGVVLYECLTGIRPFEADSASALVAKLLVGAAASPRDLAPEVPAPLSDIVLRTISADRQMRPASAAELHELLARVEV